MEGGSDVRRKKSRKRREWNEFPSEGGGGGGYQDMEVWQWRKEVEGMRKKRETGYRGYLYRLTLPRLLSCSPAVQHKAHIGSRNYKILMSRLDIVVLQWQDGFCIVQI